MSENCPRCGSRWLSFEVKDEGSERLRKPVAMNDAARQLVERGCTPEIVRATLLAWAEEAARDAIEGEK